MSCKERMLESIRKFWIETGPGDHGEFHVINYLCFSKGWFRLHVGEKMSISIGDEYYTIQRDA